MANSQAAVRLLSVALVIMPILAISGDIVGSKDTGKWTQGSFAQVNVLCIQSWICTPGVDVLHGPDTRVVTSKNSATRGVCNADNGPPDTCNSCSAAEPTDLCQFWLEKQSLGVRRNFSRGRRIDSGVGCTILQRFDGGVAPISRKYL